jgi:hypothetical protein
VDADVAPTPGLVGPGSLAARRVLVVDVLRASTSMDVAVASGCAAIVPVANAREARRRAADAGPGALMAGVGALVNLTAASAWAGAHAGDVTMPGVDSVVEAPG